MSVATASHLHNNELRFLRLLRISYTKDFQQPHCVNMSSQGVMSS
jgi:hypothetical protein